MEIFNTPTIKTKRLILRKFTKSDIEDFFIIMKDKDVNTFLPWFPLETFEQARQFLDENYFKYYDIPCAYRYAICLKEEDKPIGYIVLDNGESNDVGYGLRKEFWNKGIATEAMAAFIKEIKKAGYDFITCTHDVNNIGSGQVMAKSGMIYKYSYEELWQPKNISVNFRMYQLNLNKNYNKTYTKYQEKYPHFIEKI